MFIDFAVKLVQLVRSSAASNNTDSDSSPNRLIHGVGFQLYQGILRQNTQTVVGFVTVLVLVFLVANLLVDLLYAVLDPRIRYA